MTDKPAFIVPPGSKPAINPGTRPTISFPTSAPSEPQPIVIPPTAIRTHGSPGHGPNYALQDHVHPVAGVAPSHVATTNRCQISGGLGFNLDPYNGHNATQDLSGFTVRDNPDGHWTAAGPTSQFAVTEATVYEISGVLVWVPDPATNGNYALFGELWNSVGGNAPSLHSLGVNPSPSETPAAYSATFCYQTYPAYNPVGSHFFFSFNNSGFSPSWISFSGWIGIRAI